MEELKYIIEDSTIAELLGVQNFLSDEAAILELIKNSYDANALNLRLEFTCDSLIVTDDGDGMNSVDIKKQWMHIGKSNKEYEITDAKNKTRIQAGSKGVGRFALARLGKEIEIQSKKKGEKGIIWKTDWNNSFLDENNNEESSGTKIWIKDLREKWNEKRIDNLINYIKRTYHDTSMAIVVSFKEKNYQISQYFPKPKVGINCRSNILLRSRNGKLTTEIISDEFLDVAKNYCQDINFKYYSIETDILSELKGIGIPEVDTGALGELLNDIGPFYANFFFNLSSTKLDNKKFLYKYSDTPESVDEGVILYRNAFSISSFEGKRDWLGFGKRSRKSPAAASHPTGAWRVRENQISGFVIIDKKDNPRLQDLANRQGIDENVYYKLFVEIILLGIKEFERYRQEIIRRINEKNIVTDKNETPIIEKVIKNPNYLKNLTNEETRQFKHELTVIKEDGQYAKQEKKEIEARYKYDIRILNVLATTGLKASSIAHEMGNDRNNLEEMYNNIIDALKAFDMWDKLNEPENQRKVYRNVPYMLNKSREVSKKLIVFMDTMLSQIERKQFDVKKYNIFELINQIIQNWQRDYGWLNIEVNIDKMLEFSLSEDVIQVIMDNMILNSVQQNEKFSSLKIIISIKMHNGTLLVKYQDNGRGLDDKYMSNPFKILEVHETTRINGHGLGMWILNNTVLMTGGKIIDINGDNGFQITFTIGDKNGRS